MNLQDSFEASHHFYACQNRIVGLKIPLKKSLYIPMYEESVDLIIGFMPSFEDVIEEFHHPSGYSGPRRIVTHWNVVPLDKMNIYNGGGKNVKKEDFMISIPYHYIEITKVESFDTSKH